MTVCTQKGTTMESDQNRKSVSTGRDDAVTELQESGIGGNDEMIQTDDMKLLVGGDETTQTEDTSMSPLHIPKVRIEVATPSPHSPPAQVPMEGGGKMDDGENDEDEEDEDGEAEELEEEEEEEEEKEMTHEEKKDMVSAVQIGDIDALEDCLDKPNSDINMVWFKENLLMVAIREGQQEMAEFLLDNGVDHTYSTTVMGMRDTSHGKVMEKYQLTCRQMAYDRGMYDIVQLIDVLQDNMFPFYKPPTRVPRLRRPRPVTPPGSDVSRSQTGKGSEAGEGERHGSSSGSQSDTEGSASDDQGGLSGVGTRKSRSKRRKRRQNKDECDNVDKDKTGSVFGEGFEVDSGHHSLGSSKLRVAAVREHEKLTEKEEGANSSEGGKSPRRAATEGEKSAEPSAGDVGEEAREVQDEGYGTISLKSATPCLSPDLKPIWVAAEPTNRFRSTKSALGVRKLHGHHIPEGHCSSPSQTYQERPLQWRKVNSFGSYANESKHWRPRKTEVDSNSDPRTCGQERSSLTYDIISPASSAKLTIQGGRNSIVSMTSSPSVVASTHSTSTKVPPDPPRQEKGKVASYMLPTKSTITKQRLSPNFAPSYGVLDFTHVVRSQGRSTPDLTSAVSSSSQSRRIPQVPRVGGTKVLQRRTQHSLSFRR